MKKRLKRILAVICLLTLVFTFTVKPKKADAVFAEMTIASWLAAGGTLATVGPIVVGLAGAAVVGAAINHNWPAIEEFGGQIYDDLIAQGKTPEEIYTQDADGGFSVTASPDFIKSAAGAVDTMPETISSVADPFSLSLGSKTIPANGFGTASFSVSGQLAATGNYYVYIRDTDVQKIGSMNVTKSDGTAMKYFSSVPWEDVGGGIKRVMFSFASQYIGQSIKSIDIVKSTNSMDYYYQSVVIGNLSLVSEAYLQSGGEVYNTSEMFGAVADNAYQRELAANAALSDNQVLKITQTQDLTNATLSDMADTSAANYDESRTQTGILSSIWNIIKGIPANIAAAGLAASTAINTKMTDLWEDAGAIWSGMADSLTNIQTDVNAKIGAMQTAMSGGIDNIRTDIGAMMDNLRTGIDSLAASAAANMASWGQLTLDGIDAGIGAITSGLTNAWTKTTTAIDTAATATTTAITNLTDKLTTGMDQITTWIIDFPAMMMSIVIPPASEFSMAEKIAEIAELLEQKFGSMDELMTTIRGAFDQTGSIYEIEISLMGRQYKIVPIMLKPTIDGARPFLTAAVNLTSLTFLIHRNKKELFK